MVRNKVVDSDDQIDGGTILTFAAWWPLAVPFALLALFMKHTSKFVAYQWMSHVTRPSMEAWDRADIEELKRIRDNKNGS